MSEDTCQAANRYAEYCTGIELNGHSFEIVERFCYHRDTIGARGV